MIMLDEFWQLADHLPWKSRTLDAGETLFHRGDRVRRFYRIERGEVRLIRYQSSGGAVVLQTALSGTALAEASLFARTYHCDSVASAASGTISVSVASFRQFLAGNATANEQWMSHLGRSAQEARFRAEMLSMKKVDERLDAWLDWKQARLPERGAWRALADEIGVTPEALYRTLAKRR